MKTKCYTKSIISDWLWMFKCIGIAGISAIILYLIYLLYLYVNPYITQSIPQYIMLIGSCAAIDGILIHFSLHSIDWWKIKTIDDSMIVITVAGAIFTIIGFCFTSFDMSISLLINTHISNIILMIILIPIIRAYCKCKEK
jgi:hypothetical protein